MRLETSRPAAWRVRRLSAAVLTTAAVMAALASPAPAAGADQRTFPTPEDAVKALTQTVKAGKMDELLALFGPDGQDLVSSSDPATGRRNREVFIVAIAEGWRLVDTANNGKELVIGNEAWPFPIPLVKEAGGWRFDTAAGREEVLARRIGRNELAVIGACRTYVQAQQAYSARGHDGKPAGLYARRFASDPGTENGLYWPVKRGAPRSPLGDLVAQAADEGRRLATGQEGPTPFHGYYFRILEGQGEAARGGSAAYVVDGGMSGGFALVAWPAEYDASGVMTFVVGRDGVVYEKDLGPETKTKVASITRYDPDQTWRRAEAAPAKTP